MLIFWMSVVVFAGAFMLFIFTMSEYYKQYEATTITDRLERQIEKFKNEILKKEYISKKEIKKINYIISQWDDKYKEDAEQISQLIKNLLQNEGE